MNKYCGRDISPILNFQIQELDHKNKTLHVSNPAITILLKIAKTVQKGREKRSTIKISGTKSHIS